MTQVKRQQTIHRKKNLVTAFAITVFAMTTLGACEDIEDTDAMSDDQTIDHIINGDLVATDNIGLVRVDWPGHYCSGSLLNNRWVLTARHCIDQNQRANYSIVLGTGNTSVGVTAMFEHPTEDVALIQLNGTLNDPRANPLYPGAPGSLLGETLLCQGYGRYDYNRAGDGRLRQANLTVTSANNTEIVVSENSRDQLQWSGDSGGPCLYNADGVQYIVSVASRCAPGDYCILEHSGAFIHWAYDIIGTGPHGGRMFNEHEYLAVKSFVSFAQAKSDCESRGAHLVTITSRGENELVTSVISGTRAWIDLTDTAQEGTWRWGTGEAFGYSNWNSGEPNNAGSGEDYVEIRYNGTWNDLPSNYTASYVCEFEPHGGTMWSGREYREFEANQTWEQASSDCETIGGHLATIANSSENNFVKSQISNFRAWIGLSDAASEGSWRWETGEAFNYSNWNSGEPNNAGSGEDYVEIQTSGRWNDLPSTWEVPYICEW